MPDEPKSWRWVPGDDRDPAERWLLVEGDGPLPGPRVVLECGQVDAADQGRIVAVQALERVARSLDEFQRYYAAHAYDDMPGNTYYASKLMAIVVDARKALKAGGQYP